MRLSIEHIKAYMLLLIPVMMFAAGIPASLWMGWRAGQGQFEIVSPPSWHFEPGNFRDKRPAVPGTIRRQITEVQRDPFIFDRQSFSVAETLPELRLSMVVKNKRHKFCRINGKLYQEGQKGPDFEILGIDDDRVYVRRSGKEIWISLQ